MNLYFTSLFFKLYEVDKDKLFISNPDLHLNSLSDILRIAELYYSNIEEQKRRDSYFENSLSPAKHLLNKYGV